MNEYFEKEIEITPSVSDASGRLSYPDTFGLFMDIASTHAEQLGVGFQAMAARGLFWLTVKTQVRFYRRPRMMGTVTAATWPEKPDRMRCDRSYTLTQGGEVLAAGKTEWAVIDTGTHAIVPMAEVYPAGLRFDRPSACSEPYARFPNKFEAFEPYAEYRVRSTDIDVGGHMNNTAYVRAIIGSLSNGELKALRIDRMDVVFRASCYEGELLRMQRQRTERGFDIRVLRGEDTAVLARLYGEEFLKKD